MGTDTQRQPSNSGIADVQGIQQPWASNGTQDPGQDGQHRSECRHAPIAGLYDLECLLVTGGGRYGGRGRRLRVSPLSG